MAAALPTGFWIFSSVAIVCATSLMQIKVPECKLNQKFKELDDTIDKNHVNTMQQIAKINGILDKAKEKKKETKANAVFLIKKDPWKTS